MYPKIATHSSRTLSPSGRGFGCCRQPKWPIFSPNGGGITRLDCSRLLQMVKHSLFSADRMSSAVMRALLPSSSFSASPNHMSVFIPFNSKGLRRRPTKYAFRFSVIKCNVCSISGTYIRKTPGLPIKQNTEFHGICGGNRADR
jgi:hypothetical protein